MESKEPMSDSGASSSGQDPKDFRALLTKLSSSSSIFDQNQAAIEICNVTKQSPPSLFSSSSDPNDDMEQIITPLTKLETLDEHPTLSVNLLESLINLCNNVNNLSPIGNHPLVIPLLIKSLKCRTPEIRINAIVCVYTLLKLDWNKLLIGAVCGLRALFDVLEEEEGDSHSMFLKKLVKVILRLCGMMENRKKAVWDGGVKVIVKKIKGGIFVDKLLAILNLLICCDEAVDEIAKCEDVVGCLVGILRNATSETRKENCLSILLWSCCDRKLLKMMKDEEDANQTFSILLPKPGKPHNKKVVHNLKMILTAMENPSRRFPNLTYELFDKSNPDRLCQ